MSSSWGFLRRPCVLSTYCVSRVPPVDPSLPPAPTPGALDPSAGLCLSRSSTASVSAVLRLRWPGRGSRYKGSALGL